MSVHPELPARGLLDQLTTFVAAARRPSTQRAYHADWADFRLWAASHQLAALPAAADTVALYLADRARTHRPATLRRRLTVIGQTHQLAGLPSPINHPLVRQSLLGIRRILGNTQACKAPLTTAQIRSMLAVLPDRLSGRRDRALLLVGFAGGFRRSELAGLQRSDLTLNIEGAFIVLRRSKTDPEAQGRSVALPYGLDPATCPVRALVDWLTAAAIDSGPVFRGIDRHGRVSAQPLHADSVGLIVKRAVTRIGLDPALFGAHSLRAGFATEAYRNGADELSIMRQTGHRTVTAVRHYIREDSLTRNNAAWKLGL